MKNKEDDKVDRYSVLAGGVRRLPHVKTRVIPIVIGAYSSQETAKIFRRPRNRRCDRMPTNHGSLGNSANFTQRLEYLIFLRAFIINLCSLKINII